MKTINQDSSKVLSAVSIPELETTKRPTPIVGLLLSGVIAIGAFYLSFTSDTNNNLLLTLYLVAGVAAVIYILVSLFSDKEYSFYLQKPNKVQTKSHDLESSDDAIAPVNSLFNEWGSAVRVRPNAGKIKVSYLISKDRSFFACQVFQFVPYEFKSVSDIHCFYDQEAQKAIDQLKSIGVKG